MIGRKDDWGKLMWRLLPWKELQSVVRVLTDGADHYGCENWKEVQEPVERYSDALVRHASDYMMGIKIDPKSGLPTLAHVICNALFLMWFDNKQEVNSDGKTTHSAIISEPKFNPDGSVGTSSSYQTKTCGDECRVCNPLQDDY